MDINKGFKLDDPDIFINWDISEIELQSFFPAGKLKNITAGYHVVSCSCLSGLNCMIGFHFTPRENGKLKEL